MCLTRPILLCSRGQYTFTLAFYLYLSTVTIILQVFPRALCTINKSCTHLMAVTGKCEVFIQLLIVDSQSNLMFQSHEFIHHGSRKGIVIPTLNYINFLYGKYTYVEIINKNMFIWKILIIIYFYDM